MTPGAPGAPGASLPFPMVPQEFGNRFGDRRAVAGRRHPAAAVRVRPNAAG